MLDLDLRDGLETTVSRLRSLAPAAGDVRRVVSDILDMVERGGDEAVRGVTHRLDRVDLPGDYRRPPAALSSALAALDAELRAALELAAANLRAFHEREAGVSWRETLPQGQVVGQEVVPLRVAGLYVPGGRADYPSSVLMTAVPAQVAGVERIVVCSPPRRDGSVAPGVAAACALLGIDSVYPVGGAQAVAAMARGTDCVPRCDVIAGPGNAYVTEAKRQLIGRVAIDGLAGPSEVMILADAGADAEWLAADLLAQAEHGAGAMGALLDVGGELAAPVAAAVADLAARLAIVSDNVAIVDCPDRDAALALIDRFAPEHLELHVDDADELLSEIRTAGAVFLGRRSATAFADYVAGTNHVLPTGGAARHSQGLSVGHFQRRMSVMALDASSATRLAPAAATIAEEEGLTAHALSARLRAGAV